MSCVRGLNSAMDVNILLITFISACLLFALLLLCKSRFIQPFVPLESKPRTCAFRASRLSKSTFLIVEYDDIYGEEPYIYAKVVQSANTVVLIDTGCGGATKSPVDVSSLRVFLETVEVPDNNDEPLNKGGKMDYIIILSHCHYDHILGVEQFNSFPILASSFSPSFISRENLPEHSQCNEIGVRTPEYTTTLVQHMHQVTSTSSQPLGLSILHTPGHLPDEIAVWDQDEGMLYVGDTVYEHAPIIFDKESSILDWLNSMDYLINFVLPQRVALLNAAHSTVCRPALDLLTEARGFMCDIISGKEVVQRRWERRGEHYVRYTQQGGRLQVITPERLVNEAHRLFE